MKLKILLLLFVVLQVFANAQDKYDGALYLQQNKKAYFFAGNKYYRYDFDKNKVDSVSTINEDGWFGVPSNIDGALYLPLNKKAYFFKGNQYYKYDFKKNRVESAYTIGQDGWFGVPSNIDAVTYLPHNEKAYFFKGNKYYRYDFKSNKVDVIRTIGKDGWYGLTSNIDSAVYPLTDVIAIFSTTGNPKSDKVYFFKDEKYYRYRLKPNKVDVIRITGTDGWYGL